ncbi:hypothetical protein Cgig2_029922 [Carnegiea gigantea]|uniref:Uncharacterized protein n=1 Tax=Carnegiea gigantea TaxID=171969 RepID=A0A9Q1QJ46_9CARY|nr:hypothetical protein Cgig2_029922 [Carnegiea gigantea]
MALLLHHHHMPHLCFKDLVNKIVAVQGPVLTHLRVLVNNHLMDIIRMRIDRRGTDVKVKVSMLQRVVKTDSKRGVPFVYVGGGRDRNKVALKKFNNNCIHSTRDDCDGATQSGRRLKAAFLVQLIDRKVHETPKFPPQDLRCVLELQLETYKEFLWFVIKLRDILARLWLVIMSYRNPRLSATLNQVFGHECHTYCLRHLTNNFVKRVVVVMLLEFAYATDSEDYHNALKQLRQYETHHGCPTILHLCWLSPT